MTQLSGNSFSQAFIDFLCGSKQKTKKMAQNMLEQQLVAATNMMEQQVDAEIAKMETMDEDDFEVLRKKRIQNMKKAQELKQKWRAAGHGEYFEVQDEKEFFGECKKSKNVVCHFYRDSTDRCKIVDKHLAILAKEHMETKFIKINAEKVQFLVERLRIVVLPTICLAKDGKTVDFIVGFDELGGADDFKTEVLEWRIAKADIITYSGNLLDPPGSESSVGGKKPSFLGQTTKKNIRGRNDDDSSDDDY
ncbi:unnamed protein product [Owenia fusiformis]|uniref:Phosducin domain-containing protein n=1 Tax=Owenia fusiformis TaxID=6347 RepID=A0A8J1THK5_OWEFU|nr:unnamed protein product [Owenia fusiformis]